VRTEAFAQSYVPGLIDHFGTWLSARTLRRFVQSFSGLRIGDFGCGFHASFTRSVLGEVIEATLVDFAIAEDLQRHPRVRAHLGSMPGVLDQIDSESLDVILHLSVLEHLEEPEETLRQIRRILVPGGKCLVNVPSWRGKHYLEISAFRLGLSPHGEMDDHRMYYDVRDLWPLLVRAGFLPSNIKCFPHKFGLNTFAVCTRR
jgi:SAM-dependent methyltransferase